jgi:hypothetical protein
LHLDDVAGRHDRIDVGQRVVAAEAGQQVHLAVRARVADARAQREAVALAEGQVVGLVRLVRVHRRDDEERPRQRVAALGDGDEALLHGLEQRRLQHGRGAVDLVHHDRVGEERAGVEGVRAQRQVVGEDLLADHVAGREVGRALDPRVVAADRAGDDARERRLADAGHVLQQQVTVGQQGDERVAGGPLHLDHRVAGGGEQGPGLVAGPQEGQGVQLVQHRSTPSAAGSGPAIPSSGDGCGPRRRSCAKLPAGVPSFHGRAVVPRVLPPGGVALPLLPLLCGALAAEGGGVLPRRPREGG